MSGLNSLAARRPATGKRAPSTAASPRVLEDNVIKVPFPSDTMRDEPSRPSAVKGADPHAAEKAMLDDMLGPATKASSRSSRPTSGASSGSSADPGLLTAMAARLSKLESASRMYRDELVRKDREILKLKREVQSLKTSATVEDHATEVTTLKEQNDELKCRIHEMETFLNDYGLIWVGNSGSAPPEGIDSSSSSSSSGAGAGASSGGDVGEGASGAGGDSSSSVPAGFTVVFALLNEKIKVLNAVAGDGKAKVVHEGGAHQLRMPEGIPLTIYKNGFLVRRGPFRSYSESANRAFINDIMDGYFPSEFKEGYPDGIIFDLKDRSEEEWDDSFKAFQGKGQAVGGPSNPMTLASMGDAEMVLGAKEFLSALPQSVIRNGNVIQVRSGVAEMLRGAEAEERPDIVLVDTPLMRTISGADKDGRPCTPADVATLQVKSDTGKQTLIVKMRYDDTIADLRTFIDAHRATTDDYEIRTAFPARVYADDSETLRSAGLIPNATVMLRAKKK